MKLVGFATTNAGQRVWVNPDRVESILAISPGPDGKPRTEIRCRGCQFLVPYTAPDVCNALASDVDYTLIPAEYRSHP
jgi:hypothetical protein